MKKQFILSVLSAVAFQTIYAEADEQQARNPFTMMREQRKRMMQEMEEMFDAFDQGFLSFSHPHMASVGAHMTTRAPEIIDENDHIVVSFDLGQATDNVNAKYEDNSLVVEAPAAGAKLTVSSEKYYRQTLLSVQAEMNKKQEASGKDKSLTYGTAVVAQHKQLDGALDIENASINVDNSVLKVSVPKKVGKTMNVTIKHAEAAKSTEEK